MQATDTSFVNAIAAPPTFSNLPRAHQLMAPPSMFRQLMSNELGDNIRPSCIRTCPKSRCGLMQQLRTLKIILIGCTHFYSAGDLLRELISEVFYQNASEVLGYMLTIPSTASELRFELGNVHNYTSRVSPSGPATVFTMDLCYSLPTPTLHLHSDRSQRMHLTNKINMSFYKMCLG